ncbi:hypothetical protein ANFP_24960 [Acidithiobacillus ferrooxidans]|nr:hypothetical protein ANFP_24960 [Acidithiobacillus ferrooxidans]
MLFVRKCGGGGKTGLVATEGGRPGAQLASIAVAKVAMATRAANNSLGNVPGPCMPLHRWGTGSLGATLCCRDRWGERTPSNSTKRSSVLWWMT